MTIIMIGDKKFQIDGFVRKSIMESLLSWKAVQTLDWTNRLCDGAELTLSEACFVEDKVGNVLEVEIVDGIDPYERRTFDNCLSLSKAIEAFIENT
jgi:hypothetical protein